LETYQIAFLPIVRTTFDVALAEQMITVARKALLAAGFTLSGPDQALIDLAAAGQAGQDLVALPVDLLLIFQATFADSTMVVTLTENATAPVFLWAVPEPWTGDRLRLNSFCGINLAGHALTLRGRSYEYAYAAPDDVEAIKKIRVLAAAGRLHRQLRSARLGVVGEHPAGMDTCRLDAPALEQSFGIKVERIELGEVFKRARSIPLGSLVPIRTHLNSYLNDLDSLDQKPLNGTLSVYSALKSVSEDKKLDGLAVRCWPEFFTEMGCAACGAMSMLSDGFGHASPIPCSCEADINGTVTQLMLQILANAPAFGTDIVGVDQAEDLVALWHCGLAPLSMADPNIQARGGVHSNRGVPLVMDFALRPGNITFARISQATGNLRLVLGKGEILAVPKPFSGTSGTLKLEGSARRFLETLMHEGLEHHISFVYGDYLDSLVAFAKLARISILNLSEEVSHQ
jgi:L-fucose isomerase-like protein